MLYDKRWDAKVETKPSLQGFIAFLKTKDPNEKYRFLNCDGRCPIGQYMASRGVAWGHKEYRSYCVACFGSAIGPWVLTETPRTFGAALERARAAL